MKNTYIELRCAFEKDRKNHLSFLYGLYFKKNNIFLKIFLQISLLLGILILAVT